MKKTLATAAFTVLALAGMTGSASAMDMTHTSIQDPGNNAFNVMLMCTGAIEMCGNPYPRPPQVCQEAVCVPVPIDWCAGVGVTDVACIPAPGDQHVVVAPPRVPV